jgi:hypothetical protein
MEKFPNLRRDIGEGARDKEEISQTIFRLGYED